MTDEDIVATAKRVGFPIFGTQVVANNPADQIMADAVTEHYHESGLAFARAVLQQERERIANQIDRMPFGDTAASFAVWIRAGAP
jgi:hypothetical protein